MLMVHGFIVGLACAVVALAVFPRDFKKCALLGIAILIIVATSTWTIHLVKP